MVDGQQENLSGAAVDFMQSTADIPDTLGESGTQQVDAGQLQQPQPVVGGLSVEAVEMTLGMAFGMIAARIGEDGTFWELQPEEKRNLAAVWHPILAPLWAKWMQDTDGAIVAAVMMTAMTIGPRLMRESVRRASQTANTATAKSGVSFSLQGQPAPANQPKQTV